MRELNNREKIKLKAFHAAMDRAIAETGPLRRLFTNFGYRKSLVLEGIEAFLTCSRKDLDDAFEVADVQ